ncbi:6,7-dimethyl-8-ribityllumazine synthase [uncultured Devosia sp.]|uniref:6,7-dimethyl-8-ribityllumazine synthase n=1 Tax=uncultured Devosia sp. TaxID=211434 RepID=UPI0035C99037
MASAGAKFPIDIASGEDLHFLVVESRYDADRADELLQGVTDALEAAQASFDLISVPSVLAIPAAIAMAIEAGEYDGFIALGTMVDNQPVHVSHIVPEVTRVLLELSVVDALPLGIALVSTQTEGEAHGQTALTGNNVGGAAARCALAMAALKIKLNA